MLKEKKKDVSVHQLSSSQVLLQPDHFLYYIAGRWNVTDFYFFLLLICALNNLVVKTFFSI